ncbi:MAG: hypothetical protein QXU09_02135 [Thermoproteota archaeon]
MVEVIVQYNLFCPHCEALLKVFRPFIKKLDVPYHEEFLGGNSITADQTDFTFHVFSTEWINKFGDENQKLKLSKIGPMLDYIQDKRIIRYPVIRISYYDGIARKELYITGFPSDIKRSREEIKQFLKNIREYILKAKKVEARHEL